MTLLYRVWQHDEPYEDDDVFPAIYTVLFDPRRERHTMPIADRFRQLDAIEGEADVVIIRGGLSILPDVSDDSLLSRFLEDIPTYVLHPGLTPGQPPTLTRPPWSTVQTEESREFDANGAVGIAQLREIEMRALLARSGAVWRPLESEHYELPSRDHADAFVRIGEALNDVVDVSRVADWLRADLEASTVLLGDTGGILTLLYDLRFDALQRWNWRIPVETLPAYPSAAAEIADKLVEVRTRLTKPSDLLFVVSVNSSGRLIARVRQLAPTCRVDTICDTDTSKEPAASLCTEPVSLWRRDSSAPCPECDAGKQLISIDVRSYEQLPHRPQPKPHSLDFNKAKEHSPFWQAAQRTKAVSLHYYASGVRGRGQHRGVHINIARMLEDLEFRGLARAALSPYLALHAPTLVLIPEHPASPSLAALLNEALELPECAALSKPVVITVPSGRFAAVLDSAVGPAERVLVLDDALVRGDTLSAVRQRIYKVNQRYHHNAHVAMFVILVRPDHARRVKRVRRAYMDARDKVSLGCVERFFLPPDAECPWCREQKLLGRWFEQLSLAQPRIRARLAQLDAPIGSGIARRPETDGAPLLTEASFFGDLDEKTAFAAVSAAIWEDALDIDAQRVQLQPHYADLELLFEAFYDPVIKVAGLRTLHARHILLALQEEVVTEKLHAELEEEDPQYVYELVLAAATLKLPRQGVIDYLNRCDLTAADRDAWLEFLLATTA